MKMHIKHLFWILLGAVLAFSYSASNAQMMRGGNSGESTSENLLAIHDKDSPNYNDDCISCHGDMQIGRASCRERV